MTVPATQNQSPVQSPANGHPPPAVRHASIPASGPVTAATLFHAVTDDLLAVDAAIQQAAEVDNPVLRQTLRLILGSSGKRLRPALVVLASHLHRNTLPRRVDLAMAAELLHTATLVHDDVIDISDARRGHATVNVAFGNTLAVLTGDYLFGKSGELVAGLGSTAIMRVFSWAVMELVQGEMSRPTIVDNDLETTEREYLAKIRGKTASLLAMCTQTGAMLDAEGDATTVQRLRDYGMNLGMAFQIVDDVLDYTATEAQLGKPVGSDLRHGTVTLPALYYLRDRAAAARGSEIVRGLLLHDNTYQDRADDAVAYIRDSGAIDRSMARARAYAAAATDQLAGLADSPYLRALHDLARYVVERRD